MTRRVRILPRAEAEIHQAAEWYEAHKQTLSSEFLLQVDAAIDAIVETPLRFPIVDGPVRRVHLGSFPYHPFFRLTGDAVVIVGCAHWRRKPRSWRTRR